MKARTFQSNFAMGAIDADLHGRVDLELYTDALGDAGNMIPAVTGALRRRPGFVDKGAPKHQDRTARWVWFRRSIGDQVQLEFGDGFVRFWTAETAPILDGEEPYEIVSPYLLADLEHLRFAQSNDVLYITHRSRAVPPRVLQRHGDTDWAFELLTARNGPWRTENTDAAKTISASAIGPVGSVVTLAASFNHFQAGHVGSLLRLRQNDGLPPVNTWVPDKDVPTYALVLSDGKVYRTPDTGGKNTGTTAPLHERGTVTDGRLPWEYLHDGAGIVRIESVGSPTTATATVLALLPAVQVNTDQEPYLDSLSVAFEASPYWSEQAWSDYRGWPGDVAFTDDDRLMFSGPASDPGRLDATRTAGYGPDWVDFKPGQGTGRVVDDDAVRKTVGGGSEPIAWLKTATYPLVATAERVWSATGESPDEPLNPAGAHIRSTQLVGASEVPPELAHDGLIFVGRGRRSVHYLSVDPAKGRDERDLTVFVESLADPRIAEIVWAGAPDKVLWARTDAGDLLSLTFDPRQNVFGWVRHPLGGGFLVESLCVTESEDGRDTLTILVKRSVGGTDERRVWRMAPRWRDGQPNLQAVYLDGAVIYEGEAATTLSGGAHLAGEDVRVIGVKADGGGYWSDHAVSPEGTVSLDEAVVSAVWGLRYRSWAESLPIDAGGPGGTVGFRSLVKRVLVSLSDYVHAAVSCRGGPLEQRREEPWGELPRPVAGFFEGPVGGETARDARILVETDDGWPMTLRAIRGLVEAND